MPISRRNFGLSLAFLVLCQTPFRVHAQSYPERPIKLVVPNPPGGPSDLAARLLADGMRASLSQSIIVDNRSGASGLIGVSAVIQAPADGYTLLLTSRSSHIIAPLVNRDTHANPVDDLASVGMAVRTLAVIVASRKSNFTTLKEAVAYAKANPGRLTYGSAGVGTMNHVGVEQFKAVAGVDILHVPYRGSGPLISALMSGEVDLAILDYASAQSALDSGSVVALAQSGKQRFPTGSAIPTLAELGWGAVDLSFWLGLSVPAATPPAVISTLNVALNSALQSSAITTYAQANGWEIVGGPPDVLDEAILADLAVLRPLIERLHIQSR